MKKTVKAYGKLNLTLDVLGRREDGYHDIESVMQSVSLWDEITVETDFHGWLLSSDSGQIPADDGNVALKAARAFTRETGLSQRGVKITIVKKIPVCAGLGGGSADAGAVLNALNDLYERPLSEHRLVSMALEAGSDVPFCLKGGTALVRGRGELLEKLPAFPDCLMVICKPPFGLTAGEMYSRIDQKKTLLRPDTARFLSAAASGSLAAAASGLRNVFEPIVAVDHPEVVDIKLELLEAGALGASMTGKGPSMFGLFSDENKAIASYNRLKARYRDTFLTKNV